MKPRILIIDDDMVILKLLSRTLRDSYHVVVLPSGYEMQDMINHFRPEVIVLDVGLPDDNGYQLCRELRMLADNNAVAILFLSGLAMPDMAAHALRVGGNAFMAKPFDLAALKETLHNLILNIRSRPQSVSG